MKLKEENQTKFLIALESLVRGIKSEAEECGQLCGGLNEKELLIISYIGGHENVKMSDIADSLNAPVSTLTNIVDKLVERKYLSREHDRNDRRVINVTLAENGKTSLKVLMKKKKSLAEKTLTIFTEKEQATFINQMNVLAAVLSGKK